MRLAEYIDCTLRVLMNCAANPQRLVTIAELAEQHQLSKNHLMKIVNDLARQGIIQTTLGRGCALRLLRDPTEIRVGEVVRNSETNSRPVESFDSGTNTCTLTASCRLKGFFDAALQAYFGQLDSATLADRSAPVSRRAGKSPVSISAMLSRWRVWRRKPSADSLPHMIFGTLPQ
jgi:Rrf2 family nitric oxide-sensitive transcriptional repressor